jgi:hypothetical protein
MDLFMTTILFALSVTHRPACTTLPLILDAAAKSAPCNLRRNTGRQL